MTSQQDAIRAIEKAGGIIRCSIRSGNHKVTVQVPNGQIVVASSGYRFDFANALERFNISKREPVKVVPVKEAVERPRTRRKARTRVATPPKPKPVQVRETVATEPVLRERPSLRARLKERNETKGAA